MTAVVDPEEVQIVQKLEYEQRLNLVEGPKELFPGLSVARLGGRAPGQLMVRADSGSERWCVASDTAHYCPELEYDRPVDLFTSLPDMYRAYDILRDLATRPQT
jgi:hypothetical protein